MGKVLTAVREAIADPFTLEVTLYQGDLVFQATGDKPVTFDEMATSLEKGLIAVGNVKPLAYGRSQWDKDTVIILDNSVVGDTADIEWVRPWFFETFKTANLGRQVLFKIVVEGITDLTDAILPG